MLVENNECGYALIYFHCDDYTNITKIMEYSMYPTYYKQKDVNGRTFYGYQVTHENARKFMNHIFGG